MSSYHKVVFNIRRVSGKKILVYVLIHLFVCVRVCLKSSWYRWKVNEKVAEWCKWSDVIHI